MAIVSQAVFRCHLLNGGAQPSGTVADRDPVRTANVPLRVDIQKVHQRASAARVRRPRQALRPLGFAPTFAVFPGGPRLLDALNVGSVGLGDTSDPPTIFPKRRERYSSMSARSRRRRRPKRSSCQASHRSAWSHGLFGSCLGCEFDIGSGDMVTS